MTESDEMISGKRRRFTPSSEQDRAIEFAISGKPQITARRIRLGQIRSDVVRSRSNRSLQLNRNSGEFQESLEFTGNSDPVADSISRIPIKDLRAKRVFSPSSICDEWGPREGKIEKETSGEEGLEKEAEGSFPDKNLTGKVSGSLNYEVDDVISKCLSDIANEFEENTTCEQPREQSLGNAVSVRSDSPVCGDGNKDASNGLEVFESGVKSSNLSLSKNYLGVKRGNEVDGLKVLQNTTAGTSDEDLTQTTPPDVEIFGGEGELAGRKEREIVDSGSRKVNSSDFKTRSVLSRCSRVKLFKSPGSLSYRRLLPYLMDVSKDSSCDAVENGCLKAEKPEQDHPRVSSLHGQQENRKRDFSQTEDSSGDLSNLKQDLDNSKAEDEQEPIKNVLQYADRACSKSSTEDFQRCYSSPLHKGSETCPKRKLVHDPDQLSRRKLVRTPGSVNYRRLLPFFTDILDDNPCVSGNSQFQEQDNGFKENNLFPLSPSGTEGAVRKNSACSDDCPPQVVVASNIARDVCSKTYPGSQPAESENVPESSSQYDSENDNKNKDENVILDKEKIVEISLEASVDKIEGSDSPRSTLVSPKSLGDDATSLDTSIGCIYRNGEDHGEADITPSKTLQLETSISLGSTLGGSPPKGILKRKVTGCKGFCTCLNCSSFRLHAERAFEFSRNQMQDAEEVAADLIAEISHLKEMLAKSASVNQTAQVKETLRRSSEAAELAKQRIEKMNDDLQAHCRIPTEQKAKVRFANYVHWKVIPRVDEAEK